MTEHYYIGVDGGATKSIVRIEDGSGHLLGREIGGPASIRLSVNETWQSIQAVLNKLLHTLSLPQGAPLHVGMGLAGCEIEAAYQAFIKTPHSFATLAVTSDSHAACLGAHNGQDGAIIIAGTGVVGFQIEEGRKSRVSGWGFPHDDEGSGAWLGLNAIALTLKSYDKRLPPTILSKRVFAHFNQDWDTVVNFANEANATQFATLAPIVIEAAKLNDTGAIALLKKAGNALDEVSTALLANQFQQTKPLPCTLLGGLAPFIEPHVGEVLKKRLVPCQKTPDEGAILFLRDFLDKKEVVHE